MSRPSTSSSPDIVVRLRLCRPMIAMLVTLLPEPDSPTMPSVLPRSTENVTPSTARTTPSSVAKETRRSFTCREGPLSCAFFALAMVSFSAQPHARVNNGVEHVDDDVRDHDQRGGDQH